VARLTERRNCEYPNKRQCQRDQPFAWGIKQILLGSEESLLVFDALSVLVVDSEDEVFSAEPVGVSGFCRNSQLRTNQLLELEAGE
jgi:hypothetical protein